MCKVKFSSNQGSPRRPFSGGYPTGPNAGRIPPKRFGAGIVRSGSQRAGPLSRPDRTLKGDSLAPSLSPPLSAFFSGLLPAFFQPSPSSLLFRPSSSLPTFSVRPPLLGLTAAGSDLDLDLDARRKFEFHQRVDRLGGRRVDVEDPLEGAELELLAGLLVDERRASSG